jgi:uroporphyrinogen III methyltransferase/synthase
LRDKLGWFEKLPLFGQTIIVTRARAQSAEFGAQLRELGACVLDVPVIELAPLDDYSVLDAAIGKLESYDWLIFTSTNAVNYFLTRLEACGRDVRAVRGRICAIGPTTRGALEAFRLRPDLVPEEHVSEGVAAAFAGYDMNGATVLIPRAAAARDVIPEGLRRMGARVDIADAYRNVIPAGAEQLARNARANWITFTSGSTVKNWLALAGAASLDGVKIASIGPATSEVARKHGLRVDVEANPSTAPALIDAIVRACTGS